MLKEPQLNLQGEKALHGLEVSTYCRFRATKWLNIGVRVHLTELSAV